MYGTRLTALQYNLCDFENILQYNSEYLKYVSNKLQDTASIELQSSPPSPQTPNPDANIRGTPASAALIQSYRTPKSPIKPLDLMEIDDFQSAKKGSPKSSKKHKESTSKQPLTSRATALFGSPPSPTVQKYTEEITSENIKPENTSSKHVPMELDPKSPYGSPQAKAQAKGQSPQAKASEKESPKALPQGLPKQASPPAKSHNKPLKRRDTPLSPKATAPNIPTPKSAKKLKLNTYEKQETIDENISKTTGGKNKRNKKKSGGNGTITYEIDDILPAWHIFDTCHDFDITLSEPDFKNVHKNDKMYDLYKTKRNDELAVVDELITSTYTKSKIPLDSLVIYYRVYLDDNKNKIKKIHYNDSIIEKDLLEYVRNNVFKGKQDAEILIDTNILMKVGNNRHQGFWKDFKETFIDKLGNSIDPFVKTWDPHGSIIPTTDPCVDATARATVNNIYNTEYTIENNSAFRNETKKYCNIDFACDKNKYHSIKIELKKITKHVQFINDIKQYVNGIISYINSACNNNTIKYEFKAENGKTYFHMIDNGFSIKNIQNVINMLEGNYVYNNKRVYAEDILSDEQIFKYYLTQNDNSLIKDNDNDDESNDNDNSDDDNDRGVSCKINKQKELMLLLLCVVYFIPHTGDIEITKNILYDFKKSGDWGQVLYCKEKKGDVCFVSGDRLSAFYSILQDVPTMFLSTKRPQGNTEYCEVGIYKGETALDLDFITDLMMRYTKNELFNHIDMFDVKISTDKQQMNDKIKSMMTSLKESQQTVKNTQDITIKNYPEDFFNYVLHVEKGKDSECDLFVMNILMALNDVLHHFCSKNKDMKNNIMDFCTNHSDSNDKYKKSEQETEQDIMEKKIAKYPFSKLFYDKYKNNKKALYDTHKPELNRLIATYKSSSDKSKHFDAVVSFCEKVCFNAFSSMTKVLDNAINFVHIIHIFFIDKKMSRILKEYSHNVIRYFADTTMFIKYYDLYLKAEELDKRKDKKRIRSSSSSPSSHSPHAKKRKLAKPARASTRKTDKIMGQASYVTHGDWFIKLLEIQLSTMKDAKTEKVDIMNAEKLRTKFEIIMKLHKILLMNISEVVAKMNFGVIDIFRDNIQDADYKPIRDFFDDVIVNKIQSILYNDCNSIIDDIEIDDLAKINLQETICDAKKQSAISKISTFISSQLETLKDSTINSHIAKIQAQTDVKMMENAEDAIKDSIEDYKEIKREYIEILKKYNNERIYENLKSELKSIDSDLSLIKSLPKIETRLEKIKGKIDKEKQKERKQKEKGIKKSKSNKKGIKKDKQKGISVKNTAINKISKRPIKSHDEEFKNLTEQLNNIKGLDKDKLLEKKGKIEADIKKLDTIYTALVNNSANILPKYESLADTIVKDLDSANLLSMEKGKKQKAFLIDEYINVKELDIIKNHINNVNKLII